MKNTQYIIENVISPDFLKTVTPAKLPSNYDKDKPTILIVDDYNSIIKLFKKLIIRYNVDKHFNIVYSGGNTAGIDIVKELYINDGLSIDIVIADITYGSNYVSSDNSLHGFNGIILTNILHKINHDLIYLFITGHVLSRDTASGLYKCYNEISDDDLIDHVVYKDTPISTNIGLLKDLFKGTRYEALL